MQNIVTSDDALVEAMCSGDEAALELIIDRYTAYVGTVVWNIVQEKLDKADAKAIISDVFYLLWCNADKIQPGKLKGFLSVIARRRSINMLRSIKADLTLEDDIVQIPVSGPEDELIQQVEYAALRQSLEKMPEPDRTVFIRHYFLYQKTSQIAKAMDINVSTVKSKLRRGRESLRRELIEGGYFIEQKNIGNL